jgi:hypothetical protein
MDVQTTIIRLATRPTETRVTPTQRPHVSPGALREVAEDRRYERTGFAPARRLGRPDSENEVNPMKTSFLSRMRDKK